MIHVMNYQFQSEQGMFFQKADMLNLGEWQSSFGDFSHIYEYVCFMDVLALKWNLFGFYNMDLD